MSLKTLVCVCVFALVLVPSNSTRAEYRFTDGSEMEIQWYEQENRILNKKVCFNYKKDPGNTANAAGKREIISARNAFIMRLK